MKRREFLKLAGAAFGGGVGASAITDLKAKKLPKVEPCMGGVVQPGEMLFWSPDGELLVQRGDKYLRAKDCRCENWSNTENFGGLPLYPKQESVKL